VLSKKREGGSIEGAFVSLLKTYNASSGAPHVVIELLVFILFLHSMLSVYEFV
jgi:hypothetical protein